MDRNKKGLAWNVLISGIIALFVLGIIAYISLGPVLMETLKGVFGLANKTIGEEGFVPYTIEITSEELNADASMRALVEAINAMSEGRSIFSTSTGIPESLKIKNYTVSYYITYEFDDELFELDHTKKLSVFKTEPFNNPDQFWIHSFENINSAKKVEGEGHSQVKHIKTNHNMKLNVEYSDGSDCEVDTIKDGSYEGRQLETWDDSYSSNDCTDSPTYVQCPGIRAYYCGLRGSKYFEGSRKHWDSNGKSTTKLKTLVDFNATYEKGAYSFSRDSYVEVWASSATRGIEIISDTVDEIPILGNLNQLSFGKGSYKLKKAYCAGGVSIKDLNGKETDIIIKCEENGMICYVCNFYLPQEITTSEWITAFGDPEYLAYYESFPEGQEEYWQYATLKSAGYIGVTMMAVGSINFVTSKMGVRTSKKSVKEAMEEGVEELAETFGKEIAEKGVKEATEEAIEILAEKAGKNGIKSVVKSGLFRNTLTEIPQIGARRSRYLSEVYEIYLKEAAEQYTKKGIFKTSSKIAKEIEEQASDKFLRDLPELLTPKKLNSFGYPSQMFNTLKFVDEFGKEVTEQAAKDILANKVTQNLGEALSKKVTNAMMRDFMIEISTINAFKNLLEEGGEQFSKTAVKEALEISFEQFTAISKLPAKFQKQLLDRANKRLFKMFTKNGAFKSPNIIKGSTTEFFGDNFDDAVATMPTNKLEFMAGQLKSIYGTLKEGLGAIPKQGWVDGPYMPLAIGKEYWKTFGVSINPITQTKQLSKFVYGKRYTALLGVALLAEYEDMQNNNLAPGGVNSLLLGSPSVYGDLRKEYPLSEKAKKYYIALHERYTDSDIETNRFYLASPCKTDLVLTTQNCNCMRRPKQLHYNFGGGPIDVKKGTMFINPGATEEITEKIQNILQSNQYNQDSPLINPNFLEKYKEEIDMIDDERAVKVCEDRGLWEGFKGTLGFSNETENYITKCISIAPYVDDTQETSYCYARFPFSEDIKNYVTSMVIVAEVVIEIMTVGAATPVVVAMNVADIAISGLITELWQKWPRHEKEGISGIETIQSAVD